MDKYYLINNKKILVKVSYNMITHECDPASFEHINDDANKVGDTRRRDELEDMFENDGGTQVFPSQSTTNKENEITHEDVTELLNLVQSLVQRSRCQDPWFTEYRQAKDLDHLITDFTKRIDRQQASEEYTEQEIDDSYSRNPNHCWHCSVALEIDNNSHYCSEECSVDAS